MKHFMADNAEKAQHLRRWNILSVTWITLSCTKIYGKLRLESATPTALKRAFFDTISFVLQHDLVACYAEINIIYNIDSNNLWNDIYRGIIQH